MRYNEYSLAARARLARRGIWQPEPAGEVQAADTAAGGAGAGGVSSGGGGGGSGAGGGRYQAEIARWRDFAAFYSLRLCLCPLLESLIVIDRLLFVKHAVGPGGGAWRLV